VQAVLNEVGSERAALFGISEGGPMSLLYAATYPERTSALVLYGCYAKRSWSPDYTFGWKDEQWKRVLDNFGHHWGTPQGVSATKWAPSIASDPRAAEVTDRHPSIARGDQAFLKLQPFVRRHGWLLALRLSQPG
jgi:pimeloyl-ACP methyl ester carboxylesterase